MASIQAGYALVLDDDAGNRDFLERLLRTASFEASSAATGEEGLRMAKTFPRLALAMVDQELPDLTGLEVIARLREENPDALLVMATMHDERALIDKAFEAGIDVFLVKPHGFMELYQRLQAADSTLSSLRRLIIDMYGPRPYRGDKKWTPSVAVIPPAETPVKPVDPAQPSAPPAQGQTPAVSRLSDIQPESIAPSPQDPNQSNRLP